MQIAVAMSAAFVTGPIRALLSSAALHSVGGLVKFWQLAV